MNHIRKLHEEAMDLAEMAFVARLRGDLERASRLSRQAYEGEAQAARLMSDVGSPEPTRSVLYRSAASLALDCDEYREAERLIAAGLVGDLPEEIAEELRELFEKVNLQRLKCSAAEALSEIGGEDAAAPLIEMLKDEDSDVRGAARALSKVGRLELDRMQKENEELREKLRITERLLPDDRTKIERALYRNPLESVAILLMINERGNASLRDIEEICQEKVSEVLCDCIKNDLIVDSDDKLVLTPLGVRYTNEWERVLRGDKNV